MRKNSRLGVVAAFVTGLAVSACATTVADPGPGRTLTVLLSDDWATAAAVTDAVTDFENEHDVTVVVQPAKFGQIEEYVIADRSGSRELDVVQWHAFAAGALEHAQPVTARFAADVPDGTFVPGAVEDVTWAGEVYGVPLDVNAMVMIVNTDALAELGFTLDDLDTFEDVRRVAEAASDDLGMRFVHVPASTWSTYAWLRANGAEWFRPGTDANPEFLFDSPATIETFEFLSSMVEDGLAVPSDEIDTSEDGFSLFRSENTMALTSGTWDVARLQQVGTPFDWAVRPMPVGPSADGPGTVLGGSSLYIAEQADDVDLAWAFATHMTSPEYALRYAQEDGRLPARPDVLEDPFFQDERYRIAVEQLPRASAMRLLSFPQVFDLATRTVYEVLNEPDTVEVPTEFGALQERASGLTTTGGGA